MINRLKQYLKPGGLWVLLILLMLSNILLLIQNKQLRSAIGGDSPITARKILRQNDKISSFSAKDLNGETIDISFNDRKTKHILLFFRVGCKYCDEQFSIWKDVFSKVDRNKFEIVGLASDKHSSDVIKDYLKSMQCDSIPIALVSRSIIEKYRLSLLKNIGYHLRQ